MCVLDVLGDSPVVVGVVASTEQLHELFVMGDYNQLKVVLLTARRHNTTIRRNRKKRKEGKKGKAKKEKRKGEKGKEKREKREKEKKRENG